MSAVKRMSFAPSGDEAVRGSGNRLILGASVLAVVGIAVGLYAALVYAGTDAIQGNVQRIFYLHVPSFMGASLAFLLAVIGGIAYLITRKNRGDMLAHAGIEVGLALSLMTLVTGMLWARPIWNTYWTWDPRLTSAAVMALTYAAYLMFRGAVENPDRRRLFASVYGIFAYTTVIFTTIVIRIRPDTIHPAVIGASPQNAEGGFAMTANMGTALVINLLVWVLIVTPVLVWWRYRLERQLDQIERERADLLTR